MSMEIDWARPQSSEDAVNTASPAMKTCFRPKRSEIEPQVRMSAARLSAYASMTHCRSVNEAPRWR